MKRQAINVSPVELRRLANHLSDENKEFFKQHGIKIANQRYLIPIINKEGLSDTWEFEPL